jgi:hypothetical protein
MPWPFKDYDYYGDRYVNTKDPNAILGETMWYERDINRETVPTECILCIEAENEMYTKYAHPLYKIFKEEYSKQVLEKKYNKTDKICQHHLECIQYHFEVCETYD